MHLEELQRFMVASKDLKDSEVMTPILIQFNPSVFDLGKSQVENDSIWRIEISVKLINLCINCKKKKKKDITMEKMFISEDHLKEKEGNLEF